MYPLFFILANFWGLIAAVTLLLDANEMAEVHALIGIIMALLALGSRGR